MHRYLIASFVLCVSCGGSSASAPPAEEAPPAAESAAEAAPSAAAEAPPAETAAPAASAEASSAPAGANPSSAGGSGKPDCPKLKKDTCKVTAGCAWSEGNGAKKECVAEGVQ